MLNVVTMSNIVCALQQVVYSSSVDIRPEWVVKEQIPFSSLLKLHYQVGEPEDLSFCGKLQFYDKAFDRVTPRLEKPLQRTKKTFRSVTTSDDPVIRFAITSCVCSLHELCSRNCRPSCYFIDLKGLVSGCVSWLMRSF